MDIPPPPPPPPSPDGTPPYGAKPDGPPPPPPPPPSYETNGPYGGLPQYGQPQGPYGQQVPPQQPYGQTAPGGPPPYPGGPYGAPAGYGYPPQPQGWYAPRPTNGLAIASLVTALLCIPLVGLILGIFGLRQVNRRGDRGKGLAISGIVIGSVGTLVTALVVVLGVIGALDEGNTHVADINAGQCFNTVHSSLSDYGDEGTRSTTVDVVPCDQKHDAEAYRVFPLDPGDDGGYPGVDAISRTASDSCARYADDYLGDATLPAGMDIYYYMPPEDGWRRGDRDVTCFFGSRSGKVTGTVKDAANGDGSGIGV
ncbi:DUF4190 domain-containing protein [Streptomyces sp. NBC_01476]|uniref:DUF4190 domain-containing protein n=1 Tax=Streptomyces sp. NBC_01476 TaxID=2903881 RepID=UPI002E31E3AF|nr:DUF4190 domain-containing protein [Streptomyces sp. NBC_01476]